MLIHLHSIVSFEESCEKYQWCTCEKRDAERSRTEKVPDIQEQKSIIFSKYLNNTGKKNRWEKKSLLSQVYLRYHCLYRVFLAGLTSYFRDLNPKLHDRNHPGINIQKKCYILTGEFRWFTDDHERSEFHYFSQSWWFHFS